MLRLCCVTAGSTGGAGAVSAGVTFNVATVAAAALPGPGYADCMQRRDVTTMSQVARCP